jgi:hypothetical protein
MFDNNSLNGGKIKDGTLSTSKLNGRIGDNMFDDNSLNGGKIKDGTLSTSKLIGNIDASRITNLSIPTGFNPQRDQLSGASIQNDTITSDKIKSVDFAKVTGNIDGSRVSGNIDSSKIVGNIDGSRISGNVDGSKISGNLDGSKISGNIDSNKIKGLPNSFPGWRVPNKDNLEFGAGIGGKQVDAGKIAYNAFSDGLDIVGAGGLPRKVTIWDNLEVKGSVTANSITSSSGANLDYEQFSRATSGRRIGNWNGADEKNNSWDPAFRGARTGYIHNTAEGDTNATDSYVDFDVPQGMKQAYVVYLPWSNTRYFNIFGINNANQEVFVRRVDASGFVDGNNSGNHNGVTAASVAGVNRFKTIRVKGGKGRMHLMGVGWTREEGRAMETGFINADNVRPGTFSGAMTFNDSVNFNGAVGGNGIRVGDTHLRHDDDWVRMVNDGGKFNNNNNGYNRGFAAKNIWARDRVIADGGIVEMKGGWLIDSTDGHLRFRKNGTNVFTVHDSGNIWSAEQGWLVGDKWTYQLETYPKGSTTDHRCVDAGSTDKACNWQTPWRRFRIAKTPYQDNTKSY